MKPKKVVIVTKDGVEFFIYAPVAAWLKQAGFEVIIVAEGVSMKMWISAGWEIFGGIPELGRHDRKTLMRSDINATMFVADQKPDLIMVGLPALANLSDQFALAAQGAGVKLGFVEDLWGVHTRSSVIPNFICTLDEHAERRIRLYYPKTPKIHITGSPILDRLSGVQPDPGTADFLRDDPGCRVILLVANDESTTPMIEGLVDALGLMGMEDPVTERCIVIPRFPPKWLIDPSKAAIIEEWKYLLRRVCTPHHVYYVDQAVSTQSLIPLATEVVSIYSNVLLEAAAMGKVTVSWNSQLGGDRMLAVMGQRSFPLCSLGVTQEVWNPHHYLNRVPKIADTKKREVLQGLAKAFVLTDGENAKRVALAIMSHLQ